MRCSNEQAVLHGARLADFVARHSRLFVLSGAGTSTGSGIPDYRDEGGAWKRRPPITHQDFVNSEAAHKRYWSRSMIGFPLMANAAPNAAHVALAKLERAGYVAQLVTQNVDGLHQRAGSAGVLELHGSIHWVVCLTCQARYSRALVQTMLEQDNPQLPQVVATVAPDGDADLEPGLLHDFRPPSCERCGGPLKPDVVFFGDGVPKARVASAMEALQDADAMLVVGSSLMVYSGYRFCQRAAEMAKPIAAINLGRTRADALFELSIREPCAEVLADLAGRLME